MNLKRTSLYRILPIFAAALLLPGSAAAQDAREGINSGNYNVKQSFEFGYRFTDFTGSQGVYQTFVNYNDGPRLLEHTLEMRSLDHQGWLFDNFHLTSFGYGGDPNNVSRLRMYKNKWYNFSATFRLDRNYWDYNLLANSLNPTSSTPFVPITNSLHRFETVRRLSDYNLTLLPQSQMRFRLGYARNISEGPSFTTFHEGTDVLTFQPWKATLNTYSIGVDFRMLPKTSISYDQFLQYYKGDTTWVDTVGTTQLGFPRFFAQLSNGQAVDLGIIFNTAAGQPCSPAVTSFATSPPTANPACNAYLAYSRVGNVRTSYPTEQLSFQSSYFKNLDLSGRFVYSSSDNDVINYREFYQGLVTRTRQRQFTITGPASSKRVSVTTDLAATLQVTDKFRIVDSFYFTHFRIPGLFNMTESSLFGTSMLIAPNTFTPGPVPPSNCPTITSAGCPQHGTSSPADISNELFSLFLGQNTKRNQFELIYDFTRRAGARLGYRYANRKITHRMAEASDLLFFPTLPNRGACAGVTRQPDGSCRTTTSDSEEEQLKINEHALLFAIWARPHDQFRFTFDLEWLSADHAFTRISPRNLQRYKFRATWTPEEWASVSTSINILESRNNVTEVFHKQHNRTFGFAATFFPNDRWGLDVAYDFNDVFSQTNICFVGSLRPPGTSPCPTATALFQQISFYEHDTHSGYLDLRWKPVPRLTTFLGYSVTSTSGSTLFLNPDVPAGPLNYNYYQPRVGIELDLTRGWTWKTYWNFYGYQETSFQDITTAPREFRGNMFTLSIRYAF